GMRYLSHPVPWRDVDGTTSGPLNSMLLSIPMLCGAPASFQMARLVFWVSICVTLSFLYLLLRPFGSPAEVQFVLMPAIFTYALAWFPDFIDYASETLPIPLLCVAACLLSREWRATRSSHVRLFFIGLILGSIPFTKLQASFLALLIAAITFIEIITRWR